MKTLYRWIERIAATLAAANCIIVPIWMGLNQLQPGDSLGALFPLPLLYLLEIMLLGILGWIAVFFKEEQDRQWRWVLWLVSGILTTFVILGAWTIGLFLIPGTLLFWLLGFLQTTLQREKILPHLGAALLAGFIQAGVMLVLVHIW